MFGNGSTGLPVAVIWFALNTPQTAGAHGRQENDVAPSAFVATATGAGAGPAPGAAPIVTVAALAAETQRNALAIPVRARSFALISITSFVCSACRRARLPLILAHTHSLTSTFYSTNTLLNSLLH